MTTPGINAVLSRGGAVSGKVTDAATAAPVSRIRPIVFNAAAHSVAEAFAATRGVASPTQLRAMLKKDGRDLVAEFRALTPRRTPVAIQRWSIRRVALSLAVVAGAALTILVIVRTWSVIA